MKIKSIKRTIFKFFLWTIGNIFSILIFIVPIIKYNSAPSTAMFYLLFGFYMISLFLAITYAVLIIEYYKRKRNGKLINQLLTLEYKEVQVKADIYTTLPFYIKYALRGNKVTFYAKRSSNDEYTVLLNLTYNGIFDEEKLKPIEMSYVEFSNNFILE